MVRFAVDVPVSVTGSSEQVVQILGRYRGKIDESVKKISLMGVPAYDGNRTHLGVFFP